MKTAQDVLDAHAIQPHFRRSGEQILGLLQEMEPRPSPYRWPYDRPKPTSAVNELAYHQDYLRDYETVSVHCVHDFWLVTWFAPREGCNWDTGCQRFLVQESLDSFEVAITFAQELVNERQRTGQILYPRIQVVWEPKP